VGAIWGYERAMTMADENIDRNNRTESRAVRRRQLIEATISSIAELGLSNTTLTSVTERAGLSHGTINFHFKSKDVLLLETLSFLAYEHFDNWSTAKRDAGPEPSRQLAAIIEVDFKPEICPPEKLSVWFSFWGQVKYRPAYLEKHDRYDLKRFAAIEALCEEIIQEGGYSDIDSYAATRRIESLIDGLWLNMLLYPQIAGREAARDDAFDYLALLFPKHFARVDSISAARCGAI
jgi:TetR/AcrR family transcriptional repressor of bet genes